MIGPDASIPQTRKNGNSPTWRAPLHQRGLSDAALDRALIRPGRGGWLFRIDAQSTGYRFKSYPNRPGPKSYWANHDGTPAKKPANARFYDPAGDLAAHVAAAGGALILAAGEPDVWACYTAGLFHTTCTMAGEGTIPPWLLDQLTALGVARVLVYPDRDQAGEKHARKLASTLKGTGIALSVYALPYDMGSKADINTLLLDVGADQLPAALQQCAVWDLPEPTAPSAPVTPHHHTPPTREYASLYERWCGEVEQAAVREWQIAGPNGDDWSRRNFSSPLREDNRPSACWNYAKHGFQDFGTGEFYNTHQAAELLGVQPWEDYKAQHAPALSGNISRSALAPSTTRFPKGYPYTLRRRILNAHHRIDVQPQLPAFAVDYIYHQIPDTALPDGAWFTWGGFQDAARDAGREPGRRMVERGLDQLVAWGRVERLEVATVETIETDSSCTVCDLTTLRGNVVRLQSVQLGTAKRIERTARLGKPVTLYRFLPHGKSLENIAAHWRYMVQEHRHADVPDDVQPEWGDLTDDEIALWDEYRAPLYATASAARQKAASQVDRDMAYMEDDFERIIQGRYHAIDLGDAKLRNVTEVGDAVKRAVLRRHGGEFPAYKMPYETGRSRATEARARERIDAITVEQSRVIPAAEVTDYQRDHGLVMREFDNGMVEVKAPSIEKLADFADETERAAYGEVQERQRARAEKSVVARRREKVRSAQPVPQFKADIPDHVKPETIPAAYTDGHLYAQFSMFPLPADFQTFNPETGEVLPAGELWKRGAAYLRERQRQSECDTMLHAHHAAPDAHDGHQQGREPRESSKLAQEHRDGHQHAQEAPESVEPAQDYHSSPLVVVSPLASAPGGKVCECGRPATVHLLTGYFCPECADKERAWVRAKVGAA